MGAEGSEAVPAVDEVWGRVKGDSLHGVRVIIVFSSHHHPLLLLLILKHLPLLRGAHQQQEIRCASKQTVQYVFHDTVYTPPSDHRLDL